MKSRRRIAAPKASDGNIVAIQMRVVKGCPMSALGQKQTYAVQNGMSALPPKADMCGATRDVRFGPIADIWLRELPPCSLSGPPDDPTAGEDKNCKCEPTVEAGINNVSGKQDYGYDHREIKRSSIAAMRATTASRI